MSEEPETYRKPLAVKVWDGDRLTVSEWIDWHIARPLMTFSRRSRETPQLRERCVEYVVRQQQASIARDTTREAQALVEYITTGKGGQW